MSGILAILPGPLSIWAAVLSLCLAALGVAWSRFRAVKRRLEADKAREAEAFTVRLNQQLEAIENLLDQAGERYLSRAELLESLEQTRSSMRDLLRHHPTSPSAHSESNP